MDLLATPTKPQKELAIQLNVETKEHVRFNFVIFHLDDKNSRLVFTDAHRRPIGVTPGVTLTNVQSSELVVPNSDGHYVLNGECDYWVAFNGSDIILLTDFNKNPPLEIEELRLLHKWREAQYGP